MLGSEEDPHAEEPPARDPPEFLDLLVAGRSVTEVASDLGISGACIYNWRRQDGSIAVSCPA